MQPYINLPVWIQAIATVVLVVVTVVYVYYAWRILHQGRISTYDSKMPVLIFRFLFVKNEKSGEDEVSERIVNAGSGPALDICLKSNGVWNGQKFKFQKGDALKPWPLPVDNAIGPDNGNSDLQVCFMNTSGRLSILKYPDTKLLLTYRDVFGRKCETQFVDQGNRFKPPAGSSRS